MSIEPLLLEPSLPMLRFISLLLLLLPWPSLALSRCRLGCFRLAQWQRPEHPCCFLQFAPIDKGYGACQHHAVGILARGFAECAHQRGPTQGDHQRAEHSNKRDEDHLVLFHPDLRHGNGGRVRWMCRLRAAASMGPFIAMVRRNPDCKNGWNASSGKSIAAKTPGQEKGQRGMQSSVICQIVIYPWAAYRGPSLRLRVVLLDPLLNL